MIVVTVNETILKVMGHSGYAESGKDIVCAGVSALVYMTVRALEDLTSDKPEVSLAPGSSAIYIENLSEQGKLLIDSLFLGLCMIAEQYPDYMQIA